MASSRLPGKVLKEVLGKPLLGYHLERVARARRIDQLILATSKLPEDDAIANYCGHIGVTCHRGPSADVLSRFAACVAAQDPDLVVRLSAVSTLR